MFEPDSALAEALRLNSNWRNAQGQCVTDSARLTQAADRITAQAAEIERLREVLKPFARIAEQGVHLPAGASTPVNIDRCRDATQALGAPHDCNG